MFLVFWEVSERERERGGTRGRNGRKRRRGGRGWGRARLFFFFCFFRFLGRRRFGRAASVLPPLLIRPRIPRLSISLYPPRGRSRRLRERQRERNERAHASKRGTRVLVCRSRDRPFFFFLLSLSSLLIAAAPLWRLVSLESEGAEFDGLEALERFPTPAHAMTRIADRALASRGEETAASLRRKTVRQKEDKESRANAAPLLLLFPIVTPSFSFFVSAFPAAQRAPFCSFPRRFSPG